MQDRVHETPVRGRAGPIVPVESRIDHVLGTVLVMPVAIRTGHELAVPGPIEVLLEDGRDVGARLAWIATHADPVEHARWLPPAGIWSASIAPDDLIDPALAGFWVVLARIPVDAAGQGIWIADSLIELNWIASPPVESDDAALQSIAAVFPDAATAPGFSSLIAPELMNPSRRWRATLTLTGLTLPDAIGDAFGPEIEVRLDPVHSFADQLEARWAVALMRLYGDDPDLCGQLRRSLCAVATFESGVRAPVWANNTREIDALLAALLDPRASRGSRARATGDFLRDQPVAACWVIDDGGRIDAASGSALPTLALTNLSERSTLAWAAPPRTEIAPALEPLASRETMVTTSRTAPSTVAGLGEVTAHVGRWLTTRTVLAQPLPITPPGFRVGPLVPGWTLASWLEGDEPRAGTQDAPWATAALVERLPGSSGEWTLYVECMRPPESANDADSVRVWLGPYARPTGVIRVTRDGSVRDEIAAESAAALVESVRVLADRWSFRVRVPSRSIPSDQVVMVGLERLATGGRRWSWPRAMMPWQVEPGRARLDLDAWDGLSGQ